MALKRPVHVSQKIIVPLGIVMIMYAVGSLTKSLKVLMYQNSPLFTTSRHAETGYHFIDFRHRTAPAWIYQGLHAVPAILWSTLLPLQHVDSFRKRYPAFHRSAGYILITTSLVLSLSGYWFILNKHAHTHPNRWYPHSFNGLSPIPWPTFELALWVLAGPYYLTLYKMATTARARDFASHRKWAVLHTMAASLISMERVFLTASYVFGWALTLLPEDQVHAFFRVGHDLASMAAAEMDMFALVDMFAAGVVILWCFYEFDRAGYFRGAREYLSSAEPETVAKKVE